MPEIGTRVLSYVFLTFLVFVLVWDGAILLLDVNAPSVSLYLHEMGKKHPLVYFILGVAVGHILLPLVVLMRNGK
jgi:hypothetical protein